MRRLLPSLTLALALAAPAAAPAAPLARPQWVRGVTITQYYPVPESWFAGSLVPVPGLDSLHRVDWLYSARGIVMEGDGLGLDGKRYHLESGFGGGWVNEKGQRTAPGSNGWTRGAPYWKAFGWRNATGGVTFPLGREVAAQEGFAWSNGPAKREVPVPPAIQFAPGASAPLTFWRTIAVDTSLIPMGSRVFVPSYCATRWRGWMVATDTGSAIQGRHIDVYRRPPKLMTDSGTSLDGQRIYVIPKGVKTPRRLPACADPAPPLPV